MKTIKRTVAALLATLMLATSTSFTLAAETYTDAEALAVAKVNAAGIMTGTDKGFEPSKTLTRAEAAAIMVRMKGIAESSVKASAGSTLFSDVSASHWAAGYINVASSLGIINGVGQNMFAPDRTVTIAEMETMAIRALGAGTLVDSQGTWPVNYVNFAGEEGISDNVFNVYTAEASRLNAAIIVANTLEAPIWQKSQVNTNKEVTWTKSAEIINADKSITPAKTILNSVLNIAVIENEVLVDYSEIDKEITLWFDTNKDAIVDEDEKTDYEVSDAFDMGSLKLGLCYDAWYDTDEKEILGMWKSESSKLKTVEFTEIVKDSNYPSNITLLVDGKEVKYDVKTDNIVVNNDSTDHTYADKALTFGTALVEGGKVVAIYANEYTNAGIVSEVTDKRVKFEDAEKSVYSSASDFKLDNEDKKYVITKDGETIDASSLKEDDVVFYYVDGNDSDIVRATVATKVVEGKVTATAATYIKVDGEKYTLVDKTGFTAPTIGTEVVAYLNAAGKICMWDTVEESTSTYAIVKSLQAIEDNKGTLSAEVSLVFADGTSNTCEIDIDETGRELLTKATFDDDKAAGRIAVLKKLFGATAGAKTTAKDINDTYAYGVGVLGQVVTYKMKSDKVVVCTYAGAEADEAKVVDLTAGAALHNAKVSSFGQYDINDKTAIFTVKSSSDNYKVKVEKVELANLNTVAEATVKGYVANINSDRDGAKFVVLKDGYSLDKEGKYAVILSEEQLDKDEEFDYQYEVVYVDGTKETYFSNTSRASYIGKAVELTLNNKEITGVDDEVGTAYGAKEDKFFTKTVAANNVLALTKQDKGYLYFYETKADGTVAAALTAEPAATKYVLGDDVIFISRELVATNLYELSVGKESAVDYLDLDDIYAATSTEDATNSIVAADIIVALKDATSIQNIIVRNDKDGDSEVIAIIYNK